MEGKFPNKFFAKSIIDEDKLDNEVTHLNSIKMI